VKILHFNQHGALVGGVEGYIKDVSSALAKAGHTPSLIYFTPHSTEDLLSNSICMPVVNSANVTDGFFAQLEDRIRDFKPDIAFVHAVYQPEIIRWLQAHLPVVAYVHGPYLICPGSALYWRASRRVCNRPVSLACLMFAQTERCCFGRNPIRHLQQLLKVREFLNLYQDMPIMVGSHYMQAAMISNGLTAEQISILSPIMFEKVPPFSHSESTTILFAGRVVPEKGLHLLLLALATVKEPWNLVVAGDGDDLPHCQKLAGDLGIADRVDFIGWQKPAAMARLYGQCAMVAVPSLWPEPYGRIGPEAFYYGRPVVAFDVGGVSDWLQHNRTGFLIAPGDVQALSEALAQLLNSPTLRERLSEHAHALASRLWNANTHVMSLLTRFERVLNITK